MARLLRATLDVAKQKDRNRARVVIAVEPSVAALLFYGALRLLPDFTVRHGAGLSFSTYEPAPERAPMNLVATTFQRGEASHADLPSDMRCFSCNTFRRDPTVGFAYSREATDCEGDYAAWCVEWAATGGDGLATIDELRTTLAEVVPAVSAGALDLIVAADREVHSYLEGRIIASPSLPVADEAAAADADAYRQHLFKTLFERHAHHGGTLPHDIVPVALKWLPSFNWGSENGICDIVRSEVRRLATNPAGEKWLEHVMGEATPSLRLPDPLAIEAFVAKAQAVGCLP